MNHSTNRILTTHVGSPPRPTGLISLLQAKDDGAAYDGEQLERMIASTVDELVEKQIGSGVDVVSADARLLGQL